VDIEADANVDAEVDAEASFDLEVDVDFEPEVEIDVEVDADAWGAPEKISNASWSGYFMQAGEKFDMTFDNMSINFDGSIAGAGSDSVGTFNITGTMGNDGTFTFDKAYEGAHTVSYKGSLVGTALKGTWCIDGQDEEEFEIQLDSGAWKGSFEQGGSKNAMRLNMGVSGGGIFGCGSDDVGSFVLRGTEEGETFNFVKQYIGAHRVMYFGKSKGGDGSRTVKGKWSIPGNCDGTFGLKQC